MKTSPPEYFLVTDMVRDLAHTQYPPTNETQERSHEARFSKLVQILYGERISNKRLLPIKKVIDLLIQKGHLKKYIKRNSIIGLGGFHSQGRDSRGGPKCKKDREQLKLARIKLFSMRLT